MLYKTKADMEYGLGFYCVTLVYCGRFGTVLGGLDVVCGDFQQERTTYRTYSSSWMSTACLSLLLLRLLYDKKKRKKNERCYSTINTIFKIIILACAQETDEQM